MNFKNKIQPEQLTLPSGMQAGVILQLTLSKTIGFFYWKKNKNKSKYFRIKN